MLGVLAVESGRPYIVYIVIIGLHCARPIAKRTFFMPAVISAVRVVVVEVGVVVGDAAVGGYAVAV